MEKEKQHPLVLVFYLAEDMMKQREIIEPFVDSVNTMLHQKNSNVLAFFLPTKGEERIACINPVVVNETEMDNIMVILDDIKKSFDIGAKMDSISDDEIILDDKPCTCGSNLDSKCNCN